MAFIGGHWLDRPAREDRIKLLNELIAEYDMLSEAGTITAHEVDQWEDLDDELTKLKLVNDCEYDLLKFVYTFFSEDMNPGNPDNLIPVGQRIEKAADFHRNLCSLLDNIAKTRVKQNVAWSVGRGHAKTAYLSNAFLCHQVVYRHKRYIVEISETTDVAGDFIQWTRNQLVHNARLREFYGNQLHEKKSLNDVDNKYEFVTLTGTKVEAKGIGTQMRGLRHGSTRPDLFLLDDLESKDSVNTPELREKNKKWFREEMLPALSREGICIYMGTITHYDSVLNYVIKERKDFVSNKFPAILEWSKRDDLWADWYRIYRSDIPDAREKALEYYKNNESEMNDGKVLWPERFSYLDLMEIRENDGAKAFNQEYLGNPIDEQSQVFKPDDFTYFVESDLEGVKLDYFASADFAMGKEKGDYSALITIARNRDTGVCYVVDAFIERVHPDIFLKVIVEKTMSYQYSYMSVEAQQAQEWFAHKLKEELRRHGYPSMTRVKEVKQRVRKSLRIESLLPDIQNGRIRFKKQHRLLLEMFELYPNHNHDDGPDALHGAYVVAQEGKRKVINKPSWL